MGFFTPIHPPFIRIGEITSLLTIYQVLPSDPFDCFIRDLFRG